mgnify:CR=1 FL=1
MQETMNKAKNVFQGVVVSDKMDKSIVVRTTSTYIHPLYGKVVKTNKRYKVHDENQEAHPGDLVEIKEGRPLSKTKYMYLNRVLRRAS